MKLCNILIPRCLLGVVVGCIVMLPASGQIPQTSQPRPDGTLTLKPLSLPQLYRQFLLFQNHLDTRASELEAQGKDGTPLRKLLQNKIGFSDADFAPIRASSQRLGSEWKDFNQQAMGIRRATPGPERDEKWRALIKRRDDSTQREVQYLGGVMTPQKRTAMENFLRQFFAPKKLSIQIPSPTVSTQPDAVHP